MRLLVVMIRVVMIRVVVVIGSSCYGDKGWW